MFDEVLLTLVVVVGPFVLIGGCTRADRPAPSARSVDPVEVVEETWPDGSPRLRREVIRDSDGVVINHGRYTRWYVSGEKEYETTYDHGKKQGVATTWHRNGKVWIEEHYQDGQRHGTTTTWDERGTKRKEENHVNGKPHGTWTVWDGKGRIKWRGTRQAGGSNP